MAKIKVGVLGATGYTGLELVRLLSQHPEVSLDLVTSASFSGQDLGEVYPSLHLGRPKILKDFDPVSVANSALDLLFVAYPAGEAIKFVPALLAGGKKIIDLGADFRLKKEAVYGLPELFAAQIKKARLVANPGCYVLTSLLGLAPALKHQLIDPTDIIIDAKSGVSGAGKTPAANTHYPECNEGICPYKVFAHRHQPEIQAIASQLAGRSAKIYFTPQLAPMTRGILASIYVKLKKPVSLPALQKIYREFYRAADFVRILSGDKLPSTKFVSGSNYCDIALRTTDDGRRLAIFSVTDNLVKGASGNALQNMNLMFGLPQTTGLLQPALYP